MMILSGYWLGSQKAGMLGCEENIGLLSFQAFQPPSFNPTKRITPNWFSNRLEPIGVITMAYFYPSYQWKKIKSTIAKESMVCTTPASTFVHPFHLTAMSHFSIFISLVNPNKVK